MMIKHPFSRPAPPIPATTLPAINVLDDLAVAQTTEPTSNITRQDVKTHWMAGYFRIHVGRVLTLGQWRGGATLL
jgi:hypothetical protein